MRILTLCLFLIAFTSCGGETTRPSNTDLDELSRKTGTIEVHVYWHDQGIPDKRVDIVETGDSGLTDKQGFVRFEVRPGRYTVRAYDINRGGPCCGYVDEPAGVKNRGTARVEIPDCLFCVAPGLISNR